MDLLTYNPAKWMDTEAQYTPLQHPESVSDMHQERLQISVSSTPSTDFC